MHTLVLSKRRLTKHWPFKHWFYMGTMAIILAGTSASVSYGQANSVLQPQQAGDIAYVTGGIGDEERDALKAVAADYNLHVMSASRSGAFTGDTTVTIRDSRKQEVLSADAGPIFYAKLPPGRYTVEGASGDETRSQRITVGHSGAQHVHFSWK